MALLRPGRWGSRPQGGCLQHRTEAQRRPKGQDAGGTPALPGGSSRWCGGGYPGGEFSESRRAPFGKLPFVREPCPRPPRRGGSFEGESGVFQTSRAPAPHDGADHTRVKQVLFQTSRAPAPHDGADHPRVKQGCFRQVGPLPCRADHPRLKQGCFRQVGPLPCRADHPRVKQGCFRQVGPLPCRADHPRVKQECFRYDVNDSPTPFSSIS